jgi:hypothetical protein
VIETRQKSERRFQARRIERGCILAHADDVLAIRPIGGKPAPSFFSWRTLIEVGTLES